MSQPLIPAAEKAARKAKFASLFRKLNMTATAASKLIGISSASVATYVAPGNDRSPSAHALERLRQVVLTDLEGREAAAHAAAAKASQTRIEYQKEIA
ncbi:hypothetical protein GTW25_02720 [Aliihoeflea aestuarii]|uniref:hypothetical protein n=1 Tax=Aliihoeflea aestuarii TaxID=453840 RepID=UPI002092B120|nr:hypothetical protein [Aliihoeflea aestuarii]MCO6389941.1 hypothetical protein [Aliihoeflea aestuarii]